MNTNPIKKSVWINTQHQPRMFSFALYQDENGVWMKCNENGKSPATPEEIEMWGELSVIATKILFVNGCNFIERAKNQGHEFKAATGMLIYRMLSKPEVIKNLPKVTIYLTHHDYPV